MLETNAARIGYFQFSGNETGSDVSDYYIGAPSAFVQCSFSFSTTVLATGALFAGDTWKVAPKLTLNLGLRWDVARPWSDVYGRLTTPFRAFNPPSSPTHLRATWCQAIREFRAQSLQLATTILRSNRLAYALGRHLGENKTSIRRLMVSTTSAPRITATFGIIGDAPWGLLLASHSRRSSEVPYVTRSREYPRDSTSPLLPFGPGRFPNFSVGSLMPLYVPGFYNKNKTQMAEHYNVSIQRHSISRPV